MAKQGVAAVDRALSILDALGRANRPLSLAALAEATGMYKSTILRLLGSLESYGYVLRTETGAFWLGPTVMSLGRAFENSFDLAAVAVPALEELVAQGTESASFHVRQGAMRLCLYRVASGHSTLDRIAAGDVLPLDRGAPGKILLAFSGAAGPVYEQVRRQGWAVSYGERDKDCAALSAPVFGLNEALVGALSLSGPRERFTQERVDAMRLALLEAVWSLSRQLGSRLARHPAAAVDQPS
jgi:DNA-binding IclR family transcriptional regulator